MIIYSDHQNLEYFTKTTVLNRRQAHWVDDLSTYNFVIYYRKGTLNGKADALSQCSEYHLEKGGSNRTPQSFFRPGQFRELPKIIISSVRIEAEGKA